MEKFSWNKFEDLGTSSTEKSLIKKDKKNKSIEQEMDFERPKRKAELPPSEKFTEDEALFAQTYAARKEGFKFSEQGQDRDYEDARMLLQELKKKDIDWLDINWDKVNFDDADSIKELEMQLDLAAKIILESDEKIKKDFGLIEKCKTILLPLAISVAIIMGAENVNAKDFSKKEAVKIEKVETKRSIEVVGEDLTDYAKKNIREILQKEGLSNQIKKVELMENSTRDNYNGSVSGHAKFKVTMVNDDVFDVSGVDSNFTGDYLSKSLIEKIENGINKLFNSDVKLNIATNYQHMLARGGAIINALKSCKSQIEYERSLKKSGFKYTGHDREN
jgi:hypothetical protein